MDMITVITPVASYHREVVKAARQSVEASTFPAVFRPIHDTENRGPGWARNEGVRLATTPYLFFLDADDLLQPRALEFAIEYHEKGYYTYGDWIKHDGEVQIMPDCYRWDTPSHIVSTLMHRNTFEAIGQFDEKVDFEDSEFYLRAMKRGVCGVHSPHAFIEYRPDGLRSIEAREDPERRMFMLVLRRRYRGMSCCGDAAPTGPANEMQDGDVLVETLWSGNKAAMSAVDGRAYPRTGNGKKLWVSPHDAAAGFLMSGSGRVSIKAVYVGSSEPVADFDALKTRLREMRDG